MRRELETLRPELARGDDVSLAMVVGANGSSPRELGAVMAVLGDGRVVGSVSGGCVESEVVAHAQRLLEVGGSRLLCFGITDDDAVAVGLTCGGSIDVLVHRVAGPELLQELDRAIDAGEAVALVLPLPPGSATPPEDPDATGASVAGAQGSLVVTATSTVGTLGAGSVDVDAARGARHLLTTGRSGRISVGRPDAPAPHVREVFVHVVVPKPRLVVVGAMDHASALAHLGRFLGFHVTVCDARARFATPERFPEADVIEVAWPHRFLEQAQLDDRSAVCVLTHDPKFDVPALQVALRSRAGYVGVMGSRRSHEDRLHRLAAAGCSDAELARLRSPIGLDLGGVTPEETALSIAAELVMLRHGASGLPLRDTAGAIHRVRPGEPLDAHG